MTEYVCGFMFNENMDYVVLIKRRDSRKHRPGHWNGVGGHIEEGETPLEAMRREFKEEAGVEIKDWTFFTKLVCDAGESIIYFFTTEQSSEIMNRISTETDEIVRAIALTSVPKIPTMPNLAWLIPMAIGIKKDNADNFVITEQYTGPNWRKELHV